MNILIVSSSANGDASVSGQLAGRFIDSVREARPDATIVTRDVGARPLPHLTLETVAAIKGEAVTPAGANANVSIYNNTTYSGSTCEDVDDVGR